jgi:flagellar protein FliS
MSAIRRYAAVQNTTASKERTMVMLFEAALRHIRTGARHLEDGDRRAAAPLLDKASQIVLELQATLKPEVAPKLVDNLIEIYTFTAARLTRAIATGNARDAREAERAFAPIVDGFAKAVAAAAEAGGASGSQGSSRP